MKTTENYLAEIREIRKMMEESSRFLSLSGLSGVLIGFYALIGTFVAYRLIYSTVTPPAFFNGNTTLQLTAVALCILLLSLITAVLLTWRRTVKTGKRIWNPGSRLLLLNLAIPLFAGGVFILLFLSKGTFEFVAPGCLIFYGLALVNAAKFTHQEIFFMGLIQVALGILAALIPSAGLIMWAVGFGLIHIVYGIVMYRRYERKNNN
ncbi:hypothetical protein SAMN05444274_102409 [Mariniphaga anaerophila]|uniref:Uncharacterized protein n=1 Tax=Mariniphaga anaerophila TaxID=1484053 RepID=A0A1M4WD88_9BACT|nr:hypothetical protein [Mariniphaga anaerophila]SHE79184.1 hypothetical protein SAMN05444274_102409 [Mariniphaga anaerophila]